MFELKIDDKQTVSAIVRSDYRTADVFKKHGINYCCSGEVSVQEACRIRNIDYTTVMEELVQAIKSVVLPNNLQFTSWKLDFLAEYVMNVHHAYLYATLTSLESKIDGFITGHKHKYPGLIAMQETFMELVGILIPHCKQEDEIIFPYIKQIDVAHRRKEPYGHLFVKTLRKPLSCISGVHDEISELLQELKLSANDYNAPEHACTNHQVIYHKLKEFHNDMIQHMHLENNILYPQAREIEKDLLSV